MLSKYFGEHPSLCLVVSGVIGHLTIQRFADHALGVNALFFLCSVLENKDKGINQRRSAAHYTEKCLSHSDIASSVKTFGFYDDNVCSLLNPKCTYEDLKALGANPSASMLVLSPHNQFRVGKTKFVIGEFFIVNKHALNNIVDDKIKILSPIFDAPYEDIFVLK